MYNSTFYASTVSLNVSIRGMTIDCPVTHSKQSSTKVIQNILASLAPFSIYKFIN